MNDEKSDGSEPMVTGPCGHRALLFDSLVGRDDFVCPVCRLWWGVTQAPPTVLPSGFVMPGDRQVVTRGTRTDRVLAQAKGSTRVRAEMDTVGTVAPVALGANWAPIRAKLGDDLCEAFVFMASYQANAQVVHTYKHRATRRYLNLDETGQCYTYKHGEYAPILDEEAFNHVFG